MATTIADRKAVTAHTPVSNIPEDEDAAESGATTRQVSEAPSEGEAPSHLKAGDDGVEKVPGFKGLSAETLEAGEEIEAPDTSRLHDIAFASYGMPGPVTEIVHGVDDRVRITNTAAYPWRVHASLLITARDGSRWMGTGWFIGPHTLMTAGHVVHIKNSGVPGRDGWVRSIQVMPGRNGATLPYGSITSTSFRSVIGWTNNGDENYDYGAIILPNNLGNTTGWFGFGVYPDADLLATIANISGYPGDKPAGTQWYDRRKVASVNSRKVYYDIDTAGGQSGSAVYRISQGKRYGIAIHAYGGATTNSGTRISLPVFNNMKAWKA